MPEELATLAHAVNNGDLSGRKDVTVRLTADMDLTGFRWVPIGFGDSEFAGVFDGCGHTVRGMTLLKDGPGNYGLFGAVSGTVQNLTVAGEIRNVTGDPYSAVGGIVGELSGGVVKNCAAEFTVDGGGEPLGLFAGGVAGAAENGTLFLDGTFAEGKPKIVRNRFPVAYNSNAPKPALWLQFLDGLLYPEDIPTLQEYIGYCLIPSNKGQRMMVIKGSGGEGKSQIGAVLGTLFGSNMKDGSIGKISENRFARADLEHILLCVDDDMERQAVRRIVRQAQKGQ